MAFSIFKTNAPQAVQTETPTKRMGAIVGVLPAKGGSGASTLAVNISALLANNLGATTLVDANLQNPDASLMLGQTAQFGLLELLTGANAPTPEAVEACSVHFAGRKHPWSLLAPPLTGEATLKTQLTSIASCLQRARNNADFWIVDLPNHLDRHLVTMLDACDVIVVVFEETMAGVSAARRWWNTFAQLDYKPNRIVYVMNRAGSRNRAAEARINELAPTNYIKVPNCFGLLDDSLANGEPPVVTHPRHKFAQAIENVVTAVKRAQEEANV